MSDDFDQRAAELARDYEAQREVELKALRALLASPDGRQVLWRILARCHLFQLSFCGTERDTCLREGERSVGLWLLSELGQAEPEALATLMREQRGDGMAQLDE